MSVSETSWIATEEARLIEKYGAVPPPWIAFPDTHPYSICWRMGGGEGHVMVFSHWWRSQKFTEADSLRYFQKWPPPPRWLEWMIDVVWVRSQEQDEDEEEPDMTPYFARTESLGFGSEADYGKDMEDPRWLDEEEE